MRQKSRWVPILGWATAASILTFLLWVPLGAIAGATNAPLGAAAIPSGMLLYVLYSPVLAPLIIFVVAPIYILAFWFWGRACLRKSWRDTAGAIVMSGLVISVVPAVVVAVSCAWRPSGVRLDEVFTWLPFCLAIFWGAVTLPRWLFDSLRPGVFSRSQSGALGHDV